MVHDIDAPSPDFSLSFESRPLPARGERWHKATCAGSFHVSSSPSQRFCSASPRWRSRCSSRRGLQFPGASRRSPQRHGGGAGESRRPHRHRHSRPRRQRGRRRGGGRLCARGHLPARRQYRRRRLHGRSISPKTIAISRSTIARPRRRRRRATMFLTPRAIQTRRSRATRRLPSACPAPWRGLRWRIRNTALVNSRSPI